MKKSILFLAFFLMLNSCNILQPKSTHKLLYNFKFKTPEYLMYHIYKNFEYTPEYFNRDYWQTPKETIKLRSGDCEDLSILLMFLLYKNFNIKPSLVILKVDNDYYHAIIKIDNNSYLDVTNNQTIYKLPTNYKIIHIIPFRKTLYIANKYHNTTKEYKYD